MPSSYGEKFQQASAAERYDLEIIGSDYSTILWNIEKEFLRRFVDRYPAGNQIAYLDFACGTGRVISYMEGLVGTARGIEISESMLARARSKVVKAELVCADISRQGSAIEGKYDLITAFRFFLNAEPALRLAAMKALAARLRDSRSRVVFNVHASVPSNKSVAWLLRRVAAGLSRRESEANVLSRGAVERLLAAAGLELEEVYGYDLLSGKALATLSSDRLRAFEERLAGSRLAGALGGHRIYVARATPAGEHRAARH